MSDSESDFNLSSEGEEDEVQEEEEEEEEYYPEELREKIFNCTTDYNDLPSENSQIKKKRIKKDNNKERPKSIQQYYNEQKELERKKNKGKRKWNSGRIRNRKVKEGRSYESYEPTRIFNPIQLSYPPPLSNILNQYRNKRQNNNIINVNIDDGKSFPTL